VGDEEEGEVGVEKERKAILKIFDKV